MGGFALPAGIVGGKITIRLGCIVSLRNLFSLKVHPLKDM